MSVTVASPYICTVLPLSDLAVCLFPVVTRLCPDDLITVFEELLEVSADWYDIGLTLKLKPGILDTIKGPFKEPKSCIRDMLKDWLETSPNPSWESIVAALRRPVVRKEALANRLEDKYCTPASELPTGDFYILVQISIRLLIHAHN